MLLVQEYLETHTFGQLEIDHGVGVSFSKSGHKWSLNYDIITAKDTNELSNQCRGLILATLDGRSLNDQAILKNGRLSFNDVCPGQTLVLARPMDRFFNYGMGASAEIDWSDKALAILEKLDGSLCIVYFDIVSNQYCVATRSCPEADLLMDNQLFTFRGLFEKALKETCNMSFDKYTKLLDKSLTYSFELCTPLNRVVCDYPNYSITLIAARQINNGESGEELDIHHVLSFGVPKVQQYAYSSIKDLVSWVQTFSPLVQEGIVIRDSKFNRVKLKSSAYVAMHRLNDSLGSSPRNCLELILLGQDDDSLPFLPKEIADNLLSIKEKYRVWLHKQETLYLEVLKEANSILPNDKKTFALTLNNYKEAYRPAFFNVFSNKATSIKNFIELCRKEGTWSSSFLDNILSLI